MNPKTRRRVRNLALVLAGAGGLYLALRLLRRYRRKPQGRPEGPTVETQLIPGPEGGRFEHTGRRVYDGLGQTLHDLSEDARRGIGALSEHVRASAQDLRRAAEGFEQSAAARERRLRNSLFYRLTHPFHTED